MITVILIDDHASLRKSMRYLLEATNNIKVVAEASDGNDALFHVSSTCPDVAIIDISMPLMNGIETARQIRTRCQLTGMIMLSIHDNPEYIQRSIEVGAFGYVLKDAIASDLLEAIHTVHDGKLYFSQRISEIANQYLPRRGNDSWAA